MKCSRTRRSKSTSTYS